MSRKEFIVTYVYTKTKKNYFRPPTIWLEKPENQSKQKPKLENEWYEQNRDNLNKKQTDSGQLTIK